jgi:hypothetical protein
MTITINSAMTIAIAITINSAMTITINSAMTITINSAMTITINWAIYLNTALKGNQISCWTFKQNIRLKICFDNLGQKLASVREVMGEKFDNLLIANCLFGVRRISHNVL